MALVFLAASLAPSLLPRPWFVQAVVSGVAAALGYGFGWGAGAASRAVGRARRVRIAPSLVMASTGGAMVLLVGAIIVHWVWQTDVRSLMGMEGSVALYMGGCVVGGMVVGGLLIICGRLGRRVFAAYTRWLRRWTSRWTAALLAVTSVMVGAAMSFNLVVADRLFPALDRAYLAASQRFDPGVVAPPSPFRSGGVGSTIPWEAMGSQGRAFVAQGPDVGALERFSGASAREPIRVYAGLDTGSTTRERVEAAMTELERTGAFQREVLLLVAPTGTGWVDPYAVDPLEYLYNGDTAAVAVQYSHRPSWWVMLGNQDLAVRSSQALFEAVTRRLAGLSPPERPRLLLYGESLGSFGWEAVFEGLEDVRARTDGALWVGPPRSNRIWSRLVAGRDPDSPLWRPVVGEGRAVRFGSDGESLVRVPGTWSTPRVAYLQHASDPITWLSVDLVFQRPEWLDRPRGPDVSELMPYLPVVTFWQVVVDLVMGTHAPIGHGHKFGGAQAEAWSLIVPPPGWDRGDTDRLLDVLDRSVAR